MSTFWANDKFLDEALKISGAPKLNWKACHHCHYHCPGGKYRKTHPGESVPRCSMRVLTDEQGNLVGNKAAVIGMGTLMTFLNPYTYCEGAPESSKRLAFGPRTRGGPIATKSKGFEKTPIFTVDADGTNYIVLALTENLGVTMKLVSQLHLGSIDLNKAGNHGLYFQAVFLVSKQSVFV